MIDRYPTDTTRINFQKNNKMLEEKCAGWQLGDYWSNDDYSPIDDFYNTDCKTTHYGSTVASSAAVVVFKNIECSWKYQPGINCEICANLKDAPREYKKRVYMFMIIPRFSFD